MNIDILHRPKALENLLAGRIWPAGRRLPMHALPSNLQLLFVCESSNFFIVFIVCEFFHRPFHCLLIL